ncbi:hypothetical protein [Kineosporia succinea]|uniref:Uncharacterized protein n=1 Tax=Kineosporia succinea TaxID=84632 RepID=A0ABT9NVA9_9ACTN|nr:hypothetical protein [Kineosporia succinea]MDP9824362.1 hypothetical protein [Kineosporia succinea]
MSLPQRSSSRARSSVLKTAQIPALVPALVAACLLMTGCTGGSTEQDASSSSSRAGQGSQADQGSEAAKGKACEEYRDLSSQVDAASAEAQDLTVSTAEDGKKVTELMTKVSDLTEKADAAYALCYAEGVASPAAP